MPRIFALLPAVLCLSLVQPAAAQTTGPGLAGSYLAARLAVIAGDHREAAVYFDRAMLADPGNPLLISNAMFAYVSLGQWDQAERVADMLPDDAQGQELVYLVRFVQAVASGDAETARAVIEAGNGPGPLIDGLATGWLQFGVGDMTSAAATFVEVAEAPGLEELGNLHLALARAAVGDFEGADEILSGETGVQITATERVVQARTEILVQLDRRAEALDLLDSYTQAVPDPGLLALQARIGAGESAPYDFVTTPQQGVAEVFFNAAQVLVGDRNASLPLLMAQAARGVDPDHSDAALLVGELFADAGQNQLAAEAYSTIPEDDPQYVEAQMGLAEALAAMEQPDEAITVLAGLVAVRPDLASLQAAYADILRQEEQYEEAIEAYSATLALVDADLPRYWFIHYARAISYHELDNWDLAEADFRRALELNPEQPQVLNYLGYSLVEQRRNLDEALDMIERAVAARPDSGYIVDSLAWVYYRLGRFEEAVEPMERAVELEPNDPIVNDHLGDVYWMVGRQREAEFQWHRALSFDPEPDEAERIRRKLEVGLDQVLEEEGGVGVSE